LLQELEELLQEDFKIYIMALDTRLIGQAIGGGRPLDIAGAVRPAVQRGEQAIQRARLVEERRQQLQAEAIAQLPQLDESQVPMQMREWAMGKALEARSQALEAIRNKDLNPVERQMAIQDAVASIGKVATKAGDFKQWIAQFADTSPEDLSKLNSPQLMERVNDIFQGNFKVSGDEFVFADGTVKDFNSLVNTRHISRRSDAYRNQLTALGQSYEKYGLQGWDENDFESKINEELNNTRYSDADIASIVVDELGVDLPKGVTIDQIREDFEDNGKLDDLGDNVKNQLIDIIKNNYKKAAKTSYDRAYGRHQKIASAKIDKNQTKGLTAAQILKEQKEQREYSDRSILASQDLSKVDFSDINSITIASGGVASTFEKGEEGSPYPNDSGIILNGKIPVLDSMTDAEKMRQIIAARVENGMLEQKDVPNLLMSLKITGEEMSKEPMNPADLLAKYSTQNKQ